MKAAIMHLHCERQRRKGDATRCKTRRDAITSPPVATQHMSWAPLLWCVLSSPCRGRSFITVCALMDRREAVTLVNDQYLLPPAAQLIDRVLCGRSLCGGQILDAVFEIERRRPTFCQLSTREQSHE